MTHCHCSRCRKSTGAGHSTNIAANSESIRWLSGYESITRFELPGSERFGKWFCSHCGGPLPRVTQDGKMSVIPAGSLDTRLPISPSHHIFWGSREPWSCPSGGLPTHEELPKSWQ
ncbi:MAG TPA: GFA family protein [Candidatus Paceibacterota bacterium]|nr:GFA family protein [Candidatus Paceibacterota bacterium]